MEKYIEELYQKAKRFDEGGLYQSREYEDISQRQFKAYLEMRALFGPALPHLLEDYISATNDEIELECKHFFEQGYLLGQAASK